MNLAVMQKTIAAIEIDPDRLFMEDSFVRDASAYFAEYSYLQLAPSCNTVGCLAGWTVQANNPGFIEEMAATYSIEAKEPFPWQGIKYEATRLLEITAVEAEFLFNLHHWPTHFNRAYAMASDGEHRLAVLKERLEFFQANRR